MPLLRASSLINLLRPIRIGNPFAGDDAGRIHVVQRLKAHNLEGMDIFEVSHIGVDLLDLMDGAEIVMLIDALKKWERPRKL
ncbi:MAG: hypothetical protein ACE10C_05080 [Candidatus Binatia bacterium]